MPVELSNADIATLQQLEEALWMPATRFDHSFMENLLAPDFFEYGRSGRVYNRSDCLSVVATELQATIPLENLQIRRLTDDTALITYNSEVRYNGLTERARRSSIWTNNGSQWKIRFHQGTPFGESEAV